MSWNHESEGIKLEAKASKTKKKRAEKKVEKIEDETEKTWKRKKFCSISHGFYGMCSLSAGKGQGGGIASMFYFDSNLHV